MARAGMWHLSDSSWPHAAFSGRAGIPSPVCQSCQPGSHNRPHLTSLAGLLARTQGPGISRSFPPEPEEESWEDSGGISSPQEGKHTCSSKRGC